MNLVVVEKKPGEMKKVMHQMAEECYKEIVKVKSKYPFFTEILVAFFEHSNDNVKKYDWQKGMMFVGDYCSDKLDVSLDMHVFVIPEVIDADFDINKISITRGTDGRAKIWLNPMDM